MNRQKWKKYITIFIVLLLLGSITAVKAGANTAETEESTLGGIPLEDLNEEEARTLLQDEIAVWKEGKTIELESKYERVQIPRRQFQFDIDASLEKFKENTKRSWSTFFLKPAKADLPLVVKVDRKSLELPRRIDQKKTLENAKHKAEMLAESAASIAYKEKPEALLQPIASIAYQLPGTANNAAITQMVETLNGKTLRPDSQFSFLKAIKRPKALKQRAQEQDLLATGLFELALHTDMKIAEHHPQSKQPEYAQPGVDAAVNAKTKEDLMLWNTGDQAYEIQGETDQHTLRMALLAIPAEETYSYELENQQTIPARTVYRYSNSLSPGVEQQTESGTDGLQVDVYRLHKGADGNLIGKELVRSASYLPEPRVLLTSSKEIAEAPVPETDPTNENLLPQVPNNINSDIFQVPNIMVDQDEIRENIQSPDNQNPQTPSNGSNGKTDTNTVPDNQSNQITPEIKQALQDSLRDSCVERTKKINPDSKLCEKESEILTNWLLKYLVQNSLLNNKQQIPPTSSPELNGILKGMK